jgi:DnaK suppressor protein
MERDPMNDAEQTLYRTRLTADLGRQLDSIAGLLGAGGKVAADVSPDMRQARMDAMAQQVNTRDQLEKFNLRRRKVEAALARIDAGSYGLCCECRATMDGERLDADPAEVFCQECADEREAP